MASIRDTAKGRAFFYAHNYSMRKFGKPLSAIFREDARKGTAAIRHGRLVASGKISEAFAKREQADAELKDAYAAM